MSTTPIRRPAGASAKLESAHPLSPPQDGKLGWGALTGQPVEVDEMSADHSLLAPPAVAALAEHLRSSFERQIGVTPRGAPAEPPGALSSTLEARQ